MANFLLVRWSEVFAVARTRAPERERGISLRYFA